MHGNASIDDRVWRELRSRRDETPLMDVVVTRGQYKLVSWRLNAIGVPLAAGVERYPMR